MYKIDSLNDELSKTISNSEKCEIYFSLYNEYSRVNIDKASFYNDLGGKLSFQINYKKGVAITCLNNGSINKAKGKYDQALAEFKKAGDLFFELNDSLYYANCLSDIGSIYTLKKDFKNSFITLTEAKRIYHLIHYTDLSNIYNRFGLLYNAQSKIDSSLYYYMLSLKLTEKSGNKLGYSVNLINIGTAYQILHNYNKSIEYYLKALAKKIEIGDKQGIWKCNNNIGDVYTKIGKIKEALDIHKEARKIAFEFNSQYSIAASDINIGYCYLLLKEYNSAIRSALAGYNRSFDINDLSLLKESTRILSKSYAAIGKYKDAYEFQNKFKEISDSIVNQSNLKGLAEVQALYNDVMQENELASLKINKNQQELRIQKFKSRFSLLIALSLVIILIALFSYYRYRTSKKLSSKLREINEMKSKFFANLSHEFRTPLTLMLGPTEKLLETARPDEKKWLELIHRNASRLLFLDNQLLEFTKIDSGVQVINLVQGEITLPLKTIASYFDHFAEQKRISFIKVFPDEPIHTYFDPDILDKVCSNLLSNAIKYTPQDGRIIFRIGLEILEVTAVKTFDYKTMAYIRIDVEDNGPGIPAGMTDKIFERFYRINQLPDNPVSGTGIGLAMARELVNLHHGMMRLESYEGMGSKFSVFLPLDKAAYTTDELDRCHEYKADENKISPIKLDFDHLKQQNVKNTKNNSSEIPSILIVDDNRDMRMFIHEILNGHYNIAEAVDGKQGFDLACERIPDLVVADIMMEPVDGIEFCQNLKQDERTSHIPVIMLTAMTGAEVKISSLKTGADDYLTKPFKQDEFLIRIRNLIEQRKRLRILFSSGLKLEPGTISVTSTDERFLQKLIKIVEENIDNPDLDVEFMIQNIAMSRSQLHRKIKALTNESVTGFIRIIRIKRAAQLFEQKFGNVSDVMYAVGFNNLSYFTKCFKEVYNMTPTDFMAH
jgi:signal transduction histidine kinase/DNA-binding response OmpR family regulator